MINDSGVYILISPCKANDSKSEYRVAFIESGNNITDAIESAGCTDAVHPSVIKPFFNKSVVYTDRYDADDEAYRLTDSLYMTNPPVYRLYTTTPYEEWTKPITTK